MPQRCCSKPPAPPSACMHVMKTPLHAPRPVKHAAQAPLPVRRPVDAGMRVANTPLGPPPPPCQAHACTVRRRRIPVRRPPRHRQADCQNPALCRPVKRRLARCKGAAPDHCPFKHVCATLLRCWSMPPIPRQAQACTLRRRRSSAATPARARASSHPTTASGWPMGFRCRGAARQLRAVLLPCCAPHSSSLLSGTQPAQALAQSGCRCSRPCSSASSRSSSAWLGGWRY